MNDNVRAVLMTRLLCSATLALLLGGAAHAQTPNLTYIVTFDAPPTANQVEMLRGLALQVHAYHHLPAAVAVIPPGALDLLANLPGVKGVYPNRSLQWMLDNSTRTLRADGVWANGYTGAGIGIAVIDAGVDGTHPDLCARIEFCIGTGVKTVQNVKILGRQSAVDPVVVLEDQISTDSSSGHGTHVAGIAAGAGTASETPGKYRGVAHGAKIIGLGTGEVAEVDTVLAAFDWVLANHNNPAYNIKVINNSWGPGPGVPYDPKEPVQLAIAAAHDAGMAVVFGAGNAGPTTDTMNVFSVNPKAISAAAGTKIGHIALFSSRGVPGSSLWRPTVTAPGMFIASVRARTGFYADVADASGPDPSDPIAPPDNLSYAYASGTSMSAPHVSGVIALMQQASWAARGRYLTPDEVRNVLQSTAVSQDPARGPGGLPGYQDYSMGAGYADALAAVQAVVAGSGLQAYNDGTTTDARGFVGAVGAGAYVPLQSFETTFPVAPGAISLDVMIDWSQAAQDLDIDLYRPDGTLFLSTTLHLETQEGPNQYSSFATTIANERINVAGPAAGTWRAVVHGTVSASETAYGMWSAVYPDGAAPAAGQAAASVTVAGPAAPNLTGQPAALTATVRDSAGNPVPNAAVTWSTAGVGALTLGETITDGRGVVMATALSHSPGTQTATAPSGTAVGSVALTWIGAPVPPLPPPPPPGSNSPGKASGGGHYMQGNKRHFSFHANYDPAATGPAGKLNYDSKNGVKVDADALTSFTISGGNRATAKGPAKYNGAPGYRFELVVTDNGEPGSSDTISLVVTKDADAIFRYETGGTLGGGNIQVKPD